MAVSVSLRRQLDPLYECGHSGSRRTIKRVKARAVEHDCLFSGVKVTSLTAGVRSRFIRRVRLGPNEGPHLAGLYLLVWIAS